MKLMNIVDGMKGMVRLIGNAENVEIDALCMDSRKKMGKGAMFFCIPGYTFDGHNYAAQAVEAGVSALVVERELDVDCPQLLVSDAREAAARIAAIFYGHPAREMKLVGITGTKGKTTTSFQVKSILETAGYKVGLIGTVCSMIGDTQIPSKLTTPDHIDFQKKVDIDGSKKRIDAYIPETQVLIEQKSFGIKLDQKAKQSGGIELTPYEQAKRYNDNLSYVPT